MLMFPKMLPAVFKTCFARFLPFLPDYAPLCYFKFILIFLLWIVMSLFTKILGKSWEKNEWLYLLKAILNRCWLHSCYLIPRRMVTGLINTIPIKSADVGWIRPVEDLEWNFYQSRLSSNFSSNKYVTCSIGVVVTSQSRCAFLIYCFN